MDTLSDTRAVLAALADCSEQLRVVATQLRSSLDASVTTGLDLRHYGGDDLRFEAWLETDDAHTGPITWWIEARFTPALFVAEATVTRRLDSGEEDLRHEDRVEERSPREFAASLRSLLSRFVDTMPHS